MNIKDEAVELKPCPFCASRVLNQFKDDDNHIIECAQCGCEIRHTQHHKVSSYWNRRAPGSDMNITDEAVESFRAEAKDCTGRELSAELVRRCLSRAIPHLSQGAASGGVMTADEKLVRQSPLTACQQEVETLREGIKEIAEREQSIRDNWTRFEAETGARILELEADLEIARDKLRGGSFIRAKAQEVKT